MQGALIALAAAAGVLGAGSYATAEYLFHMVIPRKPAGTQDGSTKSIGVDWSQHLELIRECKQWIASQEPEQVEVTSFDGLCLRGQLLTARQPTDKVVLAVHGYKSQGINDFAALAKFYHEQGMDLLLVDDRAHGKSDGKYIGFGCLDRHDCLTWLDFLQKRFGPEKQVFLHGISMGAATVLMAAGLGLPPCVKGIVADCGFTSAWDVFSHILRRDYHMPPFPLMHITSGLCRQRAHYGFRDCSTLDAVAKAGNPPVLFIHGELDDFVPTWMSRSNYEACASRKELVIIPGAGHAESYYKAPAEYEAAVLRFFESCGAKETVPV